MAVLLTCGGNVVVEGCGTTIASTSGSSGSGGTTGTSSGSTTSAGTGTGGGSCLVNGPMVGEATNCNGTTDAGSGACTFEVCDTVPGASVIWIASCTGNACECASQDGSGGRGPVTPQCTCSLPAGTDACATHTNCCFPSF